MKEFQQLIWSYYQHNRREFPWRETTNPYHIVISEVMLQQTQTHRVIEKYLQFIAAFPDFPTLAQVSLREVLSCWQGLGYNRRGMYLQQVAQKVMNDHAGALPTDPEILKTFPGIGPNTAGSICAFAFNKPTIFIETNIRAVFIHFFFKNRGEVKDAELRPLIEQAVDQENPREWYYALMDYGVMLKKHLPNPSRRSAHHIQQSKFEGSERQIRGLILKALTQHKVMDYSLLVDWVNSADARRAMADKKEPERVKKNLLALCAEGLVNKKGNFFEIP